MENYIVYLIDSIEEYGKLMAYCINHDITVWRCYWDEREKGDRCFDVDFQSKRIWYSCSKYYRDIGATIIKPKFIVNKYGVYEIEKE